MSIFVVTHKDIAIPEQEGYIPLYVGYGKNKKGYLRDDSSDNIAEKNDSYCELTGLYWIWKNQQSDIVGLVHYRRYFVNIDSRYKNIRRYYVVAKKKYHILSWDECSHLLKKYQVIVKESPNYLHKTWYEFADAFGLDFCKRVKRVLERCYPEYKKTFEQCMKDQTHFNCNMFIGRKEIMDQYCEWLFFILEEIDKQYIKETGDRFHNREIGFIGEMLFKVWILHNNIHYLIVPTINTEEKETIITLGEGIKIAEKKFIGKMKKVLNNTKYLRAFFVWLNALHRLKGKDRYAFGLPMRVYAHKNKKKTKELKRFKDTHKGERCFIVGTGPSLTLEDVEKLKGEYTVGVNTIYKYFEKTDWRPDYYCVIDPDTYSNIGKDLEKYHIKNLFYACNRIFRQNVPGIGFILDCSDFYKLSIADVLPFTEFSKDIEKCVYDGASVVYAALQLAVYMGFTEIYLLGVDCNYGTDGAVHGKGLQYDNYSYNWTKNTALTMIEGFKVADQFAKRHGIRIFNATRGGMLEVFERVDLDKAVKRESD